MNKIISTLLIGASTLTFAQSYAPAAGEVGTTAIKADSSIFVAWAKNVEVTRGFVNISDTTVEAEGSNRASAGAPENAIGPSNNSIVSLGDSGIAIVTFNTPITNGAGYDFAVFENGFSHTFLELAHVEVSSDGVNFVRFPSHSETQIDTQVGGFGALDATYLNNLAGKYKGGFGTPFDLEELKDSENLNIDQITHVKIIDVVGTIGPEGTTDSFGKKINDPFPTPFASSGFDLDAIGVINEFKNVSLDDEQLTFMVYPNPSNGIINIQLNNSDVSEVYITNSLGKQVNHTTVLNTDTLFQIELPKGVYFIHISSKDKAISRKVIVR